MHDICMWIFGCDLSLAWMMVRIDSGLPSLAMVIVGLISLFVLVGSHVSLAWVELLVLEALVGQTLCKPCNRLG